MKPTLFLVDMQTDFLAEPGLEPHKSKVVAGAARLLREARKLDMPIIHIQTTSRRDPDQRMRHWKLSGRWSCLEGTAGHEPPDALKPLSHETVLDKTGFGVPREILRSALQASGPCDVAIVAGVHLHACVRQVVLDLNEVGLEVWIARDAIGSHDPALAAHTELYLRQRCIRFLSTSRILSHFRHGVRVADDETSAKSVADISRAVKAARAPVKAAGVRPQVLQTAAALVEARAGLLADEIVAHIGKPIRYAYAEVARTAALFRAVAQRAMRQDIEQQEAEALVRRRPLGTVGIITPWNNPLAIPAGLIAPAFAYQNAVVWKPSLAGACSASSLHRLCIEAGIEPDALHIVLGDDDAGLALIAQPGIDAVCFTGATGTGRVAAAACARRNLPLQAELGGNNAAIVTGDCDLESAARLICEAAFGCAGQRCTATRRVIVLDHIYDRFRVLLESMTAAMTWGDPRDEKTQIGPLLDADRAREVLDCVERAHGDGCVVLQPNLDLVSDAFRPGAFFPPTLVLSADASCEIVCEETFGPVLVVQRAKDWDEAMTLLNGVTQGLVAALFSTDPDRQQDFLQRAQAGNLKLNLATVEAGVDVPFGGWKASGLGPPQHGTANCEFFTRAQTVYAAPADDIAVP